MGINPRTVAKWRKRATVEDMKTWPTEPRSTVLSESEEAMVLAFRRHTLLPLDDCLYALQPSIPHLTRSALHRCLQRNGISRLAAPVRPGLEISLTCGEVVVHRVGEQQPPPLGCHEGSTGCLAFFHWVDAISDLVLGLPRPLPGGGQPNLGVATQANVAPFCADLRSENPSFPTARQKLHVKSRHSADRLHSRELAAGVFQAFDFDRLTSEAIFGITSPIIKPTKEYNVG